MPVLSFKQQFVPAIQAGTKRQTIRAKRKVPIQPGDRLYLFTGMRTPNCRRVFYGPLPSVICTRVEDIAIWPLTADLCVKIEGRWLTRLQQTELAIADGFSSYDEMALFFKGELPFAGDVIHWEKADHV